MEKIFGLDVSAWQEGINLAQAKNEGVKFAIIRAGYTGSKDGVSKAKDNQFETHYKNAKSNGLGVGAYWFSRATSYEKGKAEAEYMYNNCLKGKQFEYPIYIDVEDSKYQKAASKKDVTNAIKGFCEYIESKGFYVGIYANVDWFTNKIDTSGLKAYDKWVAYWGTTRPSYPEGGMWQFGGESNKIRTNKVAGMVCDQNYAYKDYPTIMKNVGLNGFTKKTTTTKTETKVEPKNESVTYTIKKGDTLSGIAKKYNTTWQKIYNDNKKVIGENPSLIIPGQKLVIKK